MKQTTDHAIATIDLGGTPCFFEGRAGACDRKIEGWPDDLPIAAVWEEVVRLLPSEQQPGWSPQTVTGSRPCVLSFDYLHGPLVNNQGLQAVKHEVCSSCYRLLLDTRLVPKSPEALRRLGSDETGGNS